MNKKDRSTVLALLVVCIGVMFGMCSSPEVTQVDVKGKALITTDSSAIYYIYFTNGNTLEYKAKGTPRFSGNGNGNFYDDQADFYYVMYVKNAKTGKYFR